MTANKIAARLLVIAGKRKKPKAKKKKKKYNKAVENAFDDIQTHMDERTDYDQNTRAFRLLMRLKSALTAEGYRFNLTSPSGKVSPSLSSTAPAQLDSPTDKDMVMCLGSLCMLISSRPPKGLTKERTEFLSSMFNSKQCYSYVLKPKNKELARKSGKNMSLPKPVTWAKVEGFGMEKSQTRSSEDNTMVLDEYRIDGIRAYTFDNRTFYAPNAGMCKRWCAGLNRIVHRCIEK